LANFPQVPAVGEEQEDRIVNEVIDRLSKSGPMLDKLVKPIGLRIVKSVHWWIAFPLSWVAVLVGSHFTIKGALELQSNLPFLGDKAIKHDDREAFEEIIRIARTAREDSPLKKSAIDEVRRFIYQVGGQWITGKFVSTSLLGKSGSLPKDDTQIPTDQLMVSLSDPDFKVRARAAMLLGNRREKGFPDGLLQVAHTDRHLLATYYAIVSFGYITRRMNRPIAAGQESIGISQLIEMFDIDQLGQ
jgi:hypothetical protein